MIPKRIFLYWCAPSLSYLRYLCLWSLRKFHPDWEIVLYRISCDATEKTWDGDIDQDFTDNTIRDYSDHIIDLDIQVVDSCSSPYPIHTGDMFRYVELYQHGGIYVDMDMFWVASINHLYKNFASYDFVITHSLDYGFQIGFLAASPGSILFREWLDVAHDRFVENAPYQACGVDALIDLLSNEHIDSPVPAQVALSPKLLATMCRRYPDVYLIDGRRLYEVDGGQAELLFDGAAKLNPEFCIHLYGGSPAFQKYNRIITEDNFYDFHGPCFDLMQKVHQEGL